jgi:hypothetical protein
MSEHTHTPPLPVDDAWQHDWALEGIAALERYLAAHAAFADYLAAHGLPGPHSLDLDDGDGAATD